MRKNDEYIHLVMVALFEDVLTAGVLGFCGVTANIAEAAR